MFLLGVPGAKEIVEPERTGTSFEVPAAPPLL
jgi:hypothetical protein